MSAELCAYQVDEFFDHARPLSVFILGPVLTVGHQIDLVLKLNINMHTMCLN